MRLVLPEADPASAIENPYVAADALLSDWVASSVLAVDEPATLYVYEMSSPAATGTSPHEAATVTRGLLGAVELRAPEDGVILPHENTSGRSRGGSVGADGGHAGQPRTHLSGLRRAAAPPRRSWHRSTTTTRSPPSWSRP